MEHHSTRDGEWGYGYFTHAIGAVYDYFEHHCGPSSIVEPPPALSLRTRLEGLMPQDLWEMLSQQEKEAAVAEVLGLRSPIPKKTRTPTPSSTASMLSTKKSSAKVPTMNPKLRGYVDWLNTPDLEKTFEAGYDKFINRAGVRRPKGGDGFAVSIGKYILEETGIALKRKEVSTHLQTYRKRLAEAQGNPLPRRKQANTSSKRPHNKRRYTPAARSSNEHVQVRHTPPRQEPLNQPPSSAPVQTTPQLLVPPAVPSQSHLLPLVHHSYAQPQQEFPPFVANYQPQHQFYEPHNPNALFGNPHDPNAFEEHFQHHPNPHSPHYPPQ
ncbi:hypothetical protein JCM8547_005653 [Rhodosporidiobolus lusitaniae]